MKSIIPYREFERRLLAAGGSIRPRGSSGPSVICSHPALQQRVHAAPAIARGGVSPLARRWLEHIEALVAEKSKR